MSDKPGNAIPAWAGAARVISAENGYVTVTVPNLTLTAKTRSRTPEPPYMWQNKEALRRIENTFDNEARVRLASFAYYALTRMASDKQSEIFECKVKDIAAYMHYNYVDALEGIKLAELAGVIRVERRKIDGSSENAPSIYEILEVRPGQAFEVVGKSNNVVAKNNKVIASGQVSRKPESIELTKKEAKKEERSVVFSSMAEAIEYYTPKFPDIPVKPSLSRMRGQKEKNGENYRLFLNTAYLDNWFARETARIPQKPQPAEKPSPAETKEEGPVPESTEAINYGPEAVKLFNQLRDQAGLGKKQAEQESSTPP
jgi:hypothetical protein